MNFKNILLEIVKTALILTILINIISYLRQPELQSRDLPKIEATLLDGTQFSVERGKPLVIHFWATWCPVCKLEASNIELVSKKYNLLSVAVNSGNNAKIKEYMQAHQLNFSVINDVDGKWAKKFKVEAYPTTFIYDAKGELLISEVGYTTTVGLLSRLKFAE
ncbi:Membrane protein, suppressor for copper-sensitivity ScsD [hydrothermal vent metagenome]|uniref:Membrane protein, suppressor for copper-sensitivity ScsD n=1 Tax=hydrothermal vent metagenome TaxID=652676 RepID=A0A1W1CLM3_9ZZZZ